MNFISEVIVSQSFVQTVLILLITAVVTGYLVPRVKATLDHDNFERQKRFENDLARQTKIREDRIKLLDELEALLWEYQFLALEPSYYQLRDNAAGFQSTFQQYDEKAPILLASISSKISKLRRLASAEIHQEFRELLHQRLLPLDSRLARLAESEDTTKDEWQQHHHEVYKGLGQEIEDVVLVLSHDFGFADDRVDPT